MEWLQKYAIIVYDSYHLQLQNEHVSPSEGLQPKFQHYLNHHDTKRQQILKHKFLYVIFLCYSRCCGCLFTAGNAPDSCYLLKKHGSGRAR